MSDQALLFTPAVKAASLIRAKKLSPVEYVDTVLKAIERLNPTLNCFRVVMADEARRDAGGLLAARACAGTGALVPVSRKP